MATIAGEPTADRHRHRVAGTAAEVKDASIARAEGWRRRAPLLPALIFMIVVTQLPFLLTLCYSPQSWNLVRPGSQAVRRAARTTWTCSRTASSVRSRVNT